MGLLGRLRGRESSARVGDLADAWLLEPKRDVALPIVGESNYWQILERLGGGRTEFGVVNLFHIAALVPEPRNKYDSNAISVRIGGHVVGYLSREDAVGYGPVARWTLAQGRYIAANARLTGGWDRGARDKGSIGVVLHIGSPAETLIELWAADRQFRLDHRWAGSMIVFTGANSCQLHGIQLDRYASEDLAGRYGMTVHPRVTKVQLLVDCDDEGASGKQRLAEKYGIPIVSEREFWQELGMPVEYRDTRAGPERPRGWQRPQ